MSSIVRLGSAYKKTTGIRRFMTGEDTPEKLFSQNNERAVMANSRVAPSRAVPDFHTKRTSRQQREYSTMKTATILGSPQTSTRRLGLRPAGFEWRSHFNKTAFLSLIGRSSKTCARAKRSASKCWRTWAEWISWRPALSSSGGSRLKWVMIIEIFVAQV